MSCFLRVVALSVIAVLAACQPKAGSPDESTAADAAVPAAEAPAAPGLAWLDACKIRMIQPDAHDWQTKWDPAHTRTVSENPSGVRSHHWADAAEQKSAQENGVAIPLEVVCASDDDARPSVAMAIVAYDSTPADIPLGPGEYPIAPKASPARNKPREFIVGTFLFDESMFAATSGRLVLDRFDTEGVAGSFVIDGHEILTGSRPLHVEGTFDMPCRKGILQSACASSKAEQP